MWRAKNEDILLTAEAPGTNIFNFKSTSQFGHSEISGAFFFSLCVEGNFKLAQTAMGLIVVQLRGHAPYGNMAVSHLGVMLGGWRDPGPACGLPL